MSVPPSRSSLGGAALLLALLCAVACGGSGQGRSSQQTAGDGGAGGSDAGVGSTGVDGGGVQGGGVGGADAGGAGAADGGGTTAGADAGSGAVDAGPGGDAGTGGVDGGGTGASDAGPGGTDGGSGAADGGSAGGGAAACAAIAPPATVAMKEFVLQVAVPATCRRAVGDASGSLGFPTTYLYGGAHGSIVGFARATGELLGTYTTGDAVLLYQQPRGFVSSEVPRFGPPTEVIGRWSSSGQPLPSGSWWYPSRPQVVEAADPGGGLLLAGDLSRDYPPTFQHAAAMVTGGGEPYAIRWGPVPLASSGAVAGLGVDALGRAIVVTDGSAAFGAGTLSAQWLDRDGTALTGEFLLLRGYAPGPSPAVVTSALAGGGVAVYALDTTIGPAQPARAIAVVDGGAAQAQPPPAWMLDRPGTRLQLLPGGEGYAVLPYGAYGVDCRQRLEVLAPDGTSCGSTEYPLAIGTCDTRDLALAEDGTVLQGLPLSMETPLGPPGVGGVPAHTCTWRVFPQALR